MSFTNVLRDARAIMATSSTRDDENMQQPKNLVATSAVKNALGEKMRGSNASGSLWHDFVKKKN